MRIRLIRKGEQKEGGREVDLAPFVQDVFEGPWLS